MENFLYSIDVSIFRWINEGWSCPPLDAFFSYLTDIKHFRWLIAFILLLLLWKGGSKGRWVVLGLAVSVTLSDQISSHIVKHLVERVRPCNALPDVLTPYGGSSAFSFPSSHAANMGSAMLLLALAYRRWAWYFVLIGLLVGLSRIYLGLHYPSDVLGGYVLGMIIGYTLWKLLGKRMEDSVPTSVAVRPVFPALETESIPKKKRLMKRRPRKTRAKR